MASRAVPGRAAVSEQRSCVGTVVTRSRTRLGGGKLGFHPRVGKSSVPRGAARKLEQLGKTPRLLSLKTHFFSNCMCSFVH